MKYFIATLLAGVISVGSFIYWIDPAGRWHHQIQFPRMPLKEGQVWATPKTNFDDRALRLAQMKFIDPPDVLLLGSSRVMSVSSRSFRPGTRIFNAGVAGPLIYDFIGFWQALKEIHKLPPYVVIFADPWTINGNAPLFYHWSVNSYVRRFLEPDSSQTIDRWSRIPGEAYLFLSSQFHKSTELLQWKELLYAWRYAREFGSAQPEPYVDREENIPNGTKAYRWDGSSLFWDRARSESDIEAEVRSQVDWKDGLSLHNWRQDDNLVVLFQALLNDASTQRARVILVLPPYHPRAFQIYQDRPDDHRTLAQYRRTFRELQNPDSHVTVCDGVDPRTVRCSGSDFADWIHMRPSCIEKVLDYCMGPSKEWASLLK